MTVPIGFGFAASSVQQALDVMGDLDRAGVDTGWLVMHPLGIDTPTLLGAGLARTERARLGTAIVPAFTRHPLALVTQAIALEGIAPGRLRLGIGTGNIGLIEGAYGWPASQPVERLREYVSVVRAALHDGVVRHAGRFYDVDATLPTQTGTPVLMAALGASAFAAAGATSDGALAWLCPPDYLERTARPALEKGAASAGRPAPALVNHVAVVLDGNPRSAREAARPMLDRFAGVPAWARMYADAGFPVPADGRAPDRLIDEVVVSGTDAAVSGRLATIAAGADELLVTLVTGDEPSTEQQRLLGIIAELASG
jgi:5,10-methylenetetrahydromethanopterin reductase